MIIGHLRQSIRNIQCRLASFKWSTTYRESKFNILLLFYMEITHAIVDLHLNSYERESGKILHVEDLKGEVRYCEYYIIYMIGPIKSIN
jgi:hypothetical protein